MNQAQPVHAFSQSFLASSKTKTCLEVPQGVAATAHPEARGREAGLTVENFPARAEPRLAPESLPLNARQHHYTGTQSHGDLAPSPHF